MHQYFYQRYQVYPSIAQKGYIDFKIIKCRYNLNEFSVNKKEPKVISNNYYINLSAHNNIEVLSNGISVKQIGLIKCKDIAEIPTKAKLHKLYISQINAKYFLTIIFSI